MRNSLHKILEEFLTKADDRTALSGIPVKVMYGMFNGNTVELTVDDLYYDDKQQAVIASVYDETGTLENEE